MDDADGQGDFHDIYEARRRFVAAFEGIAAGAEMLAARLAEAPDPEELRRAREEVDEERTANAQLAERVRALREGERGRVAELEQSLARAREEIAGLEARRAADRAEIDAVLAELLPLIEDAR